MSGRTLTEWRDLVGRGTLKRRDLAELRVDPRAGAKALLDAYEARRNAVRREIKRVDAMMEFERQAQANGFVLVAGVDEAGRGPLAGPIVAAAVVLCTTLPGINDSKMLTPEEREALAVALITGGHSIAVAEVSSHDIDAFGIQTANYRVMAMAVSQLLPQPHFALVDGFNVPGMATPHLRIIKGDQRSLSVAAASIIAKVHRDRMMAGFDAVYPEYGFARHKGYSTREHLDALARFGPCPIHRKSFAPIAAAQESGELF